MRIDASIGPAALLAGASAAACAWVAIQSLVKSPRRSAAYAIWRSAVRSASQWHRLLRTAGDDMRSPPSAGRRLRVGAAVTGALIGYSLLGPVGCVIGAIAGPPCVAVFVRARRARYARRVDASAADLALALASAIAAGHSVRGALLAAGRAVPQPAAAELNRVAFDLTLGVTVDEALTELRRRTTARRLDSICGAIELHRRSGGDLARLMRELAVAFRARDAAWRDARAATAQARFTAILVAVIPLAAAAFAELLSPGLVTGALGYAPSLLLLACAFGLFAIGALLCLKASDV